GGECADAVDLDGYRIARLQELRRFTPGAHAIRSAARNNVARIERENGRQVTQHVSFIPNPVLGVAVLLRDAVDLGNNSQVRRVRRKLFRQNERPERRGAVAALAAKPVWTGKHS